MELLVGIIAGAVTSWLITHFYYARGSRDQNALYNKLTEDLRTAILADKRASLSVRDLNELLRERTVDPAASGTLPFKACPQCGSTALEHDEDAIVDGDVSDGVPVLEYYPYKIIRCTACGWAASELDSPAPFVQPPNVSLQRTTRPDAPMPRKSGRGPLHG